MFFFFKNQTLATRTVQRAHEVSVDSNSIVVILALGGFKGKSEATKSELSSDFFFLVLIDPFLVTLIKLEVQYLILLCSCSVVHLLCCEQVV